MIDFVGGESIYTGEWHGVPVLIDLRWLEDAIAGFSVIDPANHIELFVPANRVDELLAKTAPASDTTLDAAQPVS
jgi:hypothetical protein